jgi:SAM-dependent methyltransferase
MDKDFAAPIAVTLHNERTNKKAIRNRIETMKLIDKYGGLFGHVLDIGERNLFTEELERRYNISIGSTFGDLDESLNTENWGSYDFIHYNNVIEHQFNPLFTLQEIHYRLKETGILILATPIKPYWITPARCHFHEMDQYRFDKLIARAGFTVLDSVHYWHDISLNGIRGIAGSFFTKQAVYLLNK